MGAGNRPHAARNKGPSLLAIITAASAVAFIVLAVVFVGQGNLPGLSSGSTVGPKLTVDRDRIDFGRVPYDQPVRATFVLKNVGDQPLVIAGNQISARLVEGC